MQIVAEGGKADAPDDPTKEGNSFGGWYTDNNTFINAWNFESETVTTDVSLYAKWVINVTPKPDLLNGYIVKEIAFDSKGNAWIGTFKQGIIRYNTEETLFFNSDNSIIPKDFNPYDIAVDKNDNVWIGGGHGLLKYDGQKFTLYNTQNTPMPLNVVKSVAIDSKNNIWFASCDIITGGIVKYDGIEWTVYTPDNSILPYNFVSNIEIDQSDNIWVAYYNCLVKISNSEWKIFTDQELGFTPYHINDIKINSNNSVVGVIQYSTSSMIFPLSSPDLFIFDGENTTLLSCNDGPIRFDMMTEITIDHNDYVWCYGVGSIVGVWIEDQWTKFDRSEFGGSSVWTIKEAPDHKIWIGTEYGIYIRQSI